MCSCVSTLPSAKAPPCAKTRHGSAALASDVLGRYTLNRTTGVTPRMNGGSRRDVSDGTSPMACRRWDFTVEALESICTYAEKRSRGCGYKDMHIGGAVGTYHVRRLDFLDDEATVHGLRSPAEPLTNCFYVFRLHIAEV